MNNFLQHYQNIKANQAVSGADPHRLIVLLMEKVLERLAVARGCMLREERATKIQQISAAIAVIDGLRVSLNREQGGELAANLDNLYCYMEEQLLQANIRDDVQILEEIGELMKTILDGWREIAPEKRRRFSDGVVDDASICSSV